MDIFIKLNKPEDVLPLVDGNVLVYEYYFEICFFDTKEKKFFRLSTNEKMPMIEFCNPIYWGELPIFDSTVVNK